MKFMKLSTNVLMIFTLIVLALIVSNQQVSIAKNLNVNAVPKEESKGVRKIILKRYSENGISEVSETDYDNPKDIRKIINAIEEVDLITEADKNEDIIINRKIELNVDGNKIFIFDVDNNGKYIEYRDLSTNKVKILTRAQKLYEYVKGLE